MKKLFTLIGVGILGVSSLYSQCTDLFFSEYIEGSSNNKAIEIYNPTSVIIDLSGYEVHKNTNGNGTLSTHTFSGGTNLLPGDTYVIANPSASAAILAIADDTDGGVINFNGNDPVRLYKISSGGYIDAVGEFGPDPGTGWDVNGTTNGTENYTLVRMTSVNAGNTNWATANLEWNVNTQDDITDLGQHTMTPCTPPSAPEVQFSVSNADVDENGGSIAITVNILYEDSNPTSVDIVLLGTGSATEGSDFTYASTQTVTFPANDNTAQTISIPIIDNGVVDGDLTFDLELQNTTNSATIGTNSSLEVTILDDEVAVTTIDQIDDLDANGAGLSVGQTVTIGGYVYGNNLRATGVQFTLHDGTGGIGVINFTQNFGYTVVEGDSIDVTGTIDQFNGFLQIEVTDINLHSQGHTLLNPTIVTALDESTESELVQINDVYIVNLGDWVPGGTGFNADVTDGSNTYKMRIDADVDLFSMLAPDGTFDLVGIGSQWDQNSPYDSGYEIIPRYNDDIHIKPMIIGGDQTICPGDSLIVDYSNVTYDWTGTNATTKGVVADTAGTYSVDVTYGTVTATATAVITLTNDIPDAGFTVSNTTPCINSSITITDTSINAQSISIDFGDGNNSTSSPAMNTYSSVGTFTVSIAATSAFGCVDSAMTTVTVDSCLLVEEMEIANLNVFPNPSNGKYQLNTNIQGHYNVEILDITGQMIARYNTSNPVFEIDITSSPSGIYFLKLTGDKVNSTLKLIKK